MRDLRRYNLALVLGLLCFALIPQSCIAEGEKSEERPDVWFNSSNPKQGFISCTVENDRHVYFINISPSLKGTSDQVAGLSIMWSGKCDPTQTKLQFDWAPNGSEETTSPEIRIQYLKGSAFNPHFANVSKKEYTSTKIEDDASRVNYDLPFTDERKLLRVAILGRAKKYTGVHLRIWNLKIGGLTPGKTLPWSLGKHDPILTKRSGNLNSKQRRIKLPSNDSTSTRIKHTNATINSLYKKADQLIQSAQSRRANERSQKARPQPLGQAPQADTKNYDSRNDTGYLDEPQWKQECKNVENQFKSLIEQYQQKEGSESRTAAKLQWHLASLYRFSGNGDSELLLEKTYATLFPHCPGCAENDMVAMLSPPPDASIEYVLKHGWWTCRRCAEYADIPPFKAKGFEAK